MFTGNKSGANALIRFSPMTNTAEVQVAVDIISLTYVPTTEYIPGILVMLHISQVKEATMWQEIFSLM